MDIALLYRFEIKTTFPFSKYDNPICKSPSAKTKLKRKLLLLVDPRKINSSIWDDYINNNRNVRTLIDAAQQIAGKKLFCNTRLLSGIPLHANGRTNVYREAGIQFFEQNFCISQTSTRIHSSAFHFFARKFRQSHQSRTIRSIRRRHRNTRQ